MNILFTICGRAGSKGVKGKNLRDFCGAPLIWYTFAAISLYREQYVENGDQIQVVLNTDSEELIQQISSLPDAPFVIRRDASLAGDQVAKAAVILDCLDRAEAHFGTMFDMVVDLDITSPLRTVTDVRVAIERKYARLDTDVVFSVTSARRNPYFNMVRQEGDFFVKVVPSNYTARQQAPVLYDMNASIYAYSPRALREKDLATFFNDRADVIQMMDTGILDIDSEEDYLLMQVIAEYLFQNYECFRVIQEQTKFWKNCI